MKPIALNTITDLYVFVESAMERTGLILDHDAPHRPWARAVSSGTTGIRWVYPVAAIPDALFTHLGNFAKTNVSYKAFVLLENGRVLKAVDADAVEGSSQPHRLAAIVDSAFFPKREKEAGLHKSPFAVLDISEDASVEEIKKKYKQLVLEYHPDRVAHLGQELKELAAKKTTEINAAFAAIRRLRKF